METELRLPEIRKEVHDRIGELMLAHGYKLNKSDSSFKKKIDSNLIQLSIDYYDFFPSSYQIRFRYQFVNSYVQEIKKQFFEDYLSLEYLKLWDHIVYEGVYQDEIKNEEYKAKVAFKHDLITHADLDNALWQMRNKISNHLLINDNYYVTVPGLNYLLNTEYEMLINFFEPEAILTSVIVARLMQSPIYEELNSYLDFELQNLSKKGEFFGRVFNLRRKLYDFMKVYQIRDL